MNLKFNLKNKWIQYVANGLISWVLLMIFGLFFFLQKDSLLQDFPDNDLQLFTTLRQPIYEAGMILASGLFLMFLLKTLKKNLIVIVLGIITLILYFYLMKIRGL